MLTVTPGGNVNSYCYSEQEGMLTFTAIYIYREQEEMLTFTAIVSRREC